MFNFFNAIISKKTIPEGELKFSEELYKFTDLIINENNFSLVRFGDGEMMIINGQQTNLSKKKEHTYSPSSKSDESQRQLLTKALTYKSSNYYVGISCSSCVGQNNFDRMYESSKQNPSNLTFATVFVNSNYPTFRSKTVPALTSRKVSFIGRESGNPTGLAFSIERYFRVGENAWINDYDRLIKELSEYILNNSIENHVFVFCAGVLSNLLIYKISKNFPNNTYLDAGSVFDVELGLGKSRKYLKNGKTLRHTCIWGK